MNEYDVQAKEWLENNNITLEIEFVKYDIFDNFNDGEYRDIYRFTLKVEEDTRTYINLFGQSIANAGVEPRAYDILSCLTKYDPESFEDFCSNFGYDEDSRRAHKVYEAVSQEWEGLNSILTTDQLESLAEIQ